jgi:propionyl-CoA carboxylase alpha chain
MQHPRWQKGALSTGFIPEEFPDGFKPREAKGEELEVVVAVAASVDHQSNLRRREITHQMAGDRVRFATQRVVKVGDQRVSVEISGPQSGPLQIVFRDKGGKPIRTLAASSTWLPGDPVWNGKVGDRFVNVQIRPIVNGVNLSYRGIQVPVHVYTQREAALAALMPAKAAADTSKVLLCPMPGLVKAINVAEGQEVQPGDSLAVVEAMKMENILRAERKALVKKINAKAGDSLAVDAVIMEFA